ncbi:SRPBCC domain-containing protein [Kaistella sp. G5-32]|uniref:SRPBCC domain-containing protein n=1 Tax=Kaistella gelatinilytica TaxID=2787636 RepID=A0ABS0F8M4_9FLAO|nr:SRPBCC domain-containing protein [Kaistella gelatinilytica]MBF8456043.1 SRPBCC domain-containing protein [Kaistella gelatinilytica]
METLNYEIIINAPAQKVWDILWNEKTYPEWTKFFMEGSQLKTDWKVNGQTYFLDAKGNGMVSTIKNLNEPHEIIFAHLGMIKDGVEDTKSQAVAEWSGMEEKYFLRAINENTTGLRAITHIEKNYVEYMNNGFNKGFEIIKELAEKS